MQRLCFLLLSVPLVLVACGGSDAGSVFDKTGGDDTGSSAADTGSSGSDTSTTVEEDAAPPPPPEDTGTVTDDTSPVIPDDTAPPPVDTGVACTETYSKTFAGHCYFPINARYFYSARDVCVSLGAHLATITSAEEQAVVESIASGDRWIGLAKDYSAPAVATNYKWITGETGSYSHWQAGEPNGSGSCARLRSDGTWADYSCNTNLIAICERE